MKRFFYIGIHGPLVALTLGMNTKENAVMTVILGTISGVVLLGILILWVL